MDAFLFHKINFKKCFSDKKTGPFGPFCFINNIEVFCLCLHNFQELLKHILFPHLSSFVTSKLIKIYKFTRLIIETYKLLKFILELFQIPYGISFQIITI